MPDVLPLDQAKQDFVQHITGDKLLASVYDDLQKVKEADGGNLADDKVAAKFKADLADLNKTVHQYLPDFSITTTDDQGQILFTKNNGDLVYANSSKPMPLQDGDLLKTSVADQSKTVDSKATSQVTADSAGFAVDIKYPLGADGKQHETKFAYDDTPDFHQLTKITKDDGTTYDLITDDKSPDKGKWTVTDPTGKTSVEDLKVGITPNGDWTRTEGGHTITEKADGTVDDKPAGPLNADDAKEAKEAEVKKQMMDDATQRKGEGPYQTAERLLPGASYAETIALAHVLKKYYQEHNDDNTDKLVKLKLGNHWLTEDNFSEIMEKSPALKARYAKLQEN